MQSPILRLVYPIATGKCRSARRWRRRTDGDHLSRSILNVEYAMSQHIDFRSLCSTTSLKELDSLDGRRQCRRLTLSTSRTGLLLAVATLAEGIDVLSYSPVGRMVPADALRACLQ